MAMTFYGCKHNQNPIILKENEFEENPDKWNLYKELFGFKKEDNSQLLGYKQPSLLKAWSLATLLRRDDD